MVSVAMADDTLQDLIKQMGSKDNAIALEAVEALRRKGWLHNENVEQANLTGANLQEVDLGGATLERMTLWDANLKDANLYKANLPRAPMDGADLERANLSFADMEAASLKHAKLQRARLSGANLKDANLQYASLQGADISGANLSGADFRHASLEGAWLSSANLQGTIFQDSNLQGIEFLLAEQLVLADSLQRAVMSDGSRYDGRFRLPGDVRELQEAGILDLPSATAEYYGVSKDDYLSGQEWAESNLEQVREEGKLRLKEWGF